MNEKKKEGETKMNEKKKEGVFDMVAIIWIWAIIHSKLEKRK